jgi:hypothetical protein
MSAAPVSDPPGEALAPRPTRSPDDPEVQAALALISAAVQHAVLALMRHEAAARARARPGSEEGER